MAKLQVALDFVDLERALQVAREALEGGADWLEAGTPLIKSEGLNAVRELKRNFPGAKIVADMKTVDTGALETEIACKAGADVVSLLASAEDNTIREAVLAAQRYGAKIMVDLFTASDPIQRAKELELLGVDYICAHAGIDRQMVGVTSMGLARQLQGVVKTPLAIAGGINSETVAEASKLAEVVIVGGARTKAPDAREATLVLKQAMLSGESVPSTLYKKFGEADLREIFLRVSTPNLSDAMQHRGEIRGLRNLFGLRFAGKALTVRTYDGDWAKPVEALEQASEGSVIVIDARPGEKAVWGELASHSAVGKKLAGIIVDGAVRDVDEIRKLNFPVFAAKVSSGAGDPKGWGEIGPEVWIGGVIVTSGDWIVGDENGLVSVPREQAVEIANRAIDVMERENRIREEIQRGKTLSEVAYLKKWEKVG